MGHLTDRLWKACAAAASAACLMVSPGVAQPRPDLVLSGEMTGRDHETYREVPFTVPAGTETLTVEFEYAGRDERSVIDLGVRDPERFRGWSGGNKSRFVIAESWATPSYLPGPLPSGEWKLVLGVPNIRAGSRAPYTARVYFGRDAGFSGFTRAPLSAERRWYRGDLHLHTGQSDGSCASRKGARIPCPLHLTIEAAAARRLDFVAVTEHNTASHHQALAELQTYYDDLLLIPGREITTFRGHANVFGATGRLDFQLGGPRAPTLSTILAQVEAAGGLISINHPAAPAGEACMGCAWTADTDFSRIPAIEAINGGFLAEGDAEGQRGGIPFWEARLNAGLRVTAIGSSDNHDPKRGPGPAAVGTPSTVVFADALSQPAILAAIRAGHVFVDVAGSGDRILEVTALAGGAQAQMGDALHAPAGTEVRLQVHVAGASGGQISLAGPLAAAVQAGPPLGPDETRVISLVSDGRRGWIRADVRGRDGRLWLLGNPIYLNLP